MIVEITVCLAALFALRLIIPAGQIEEIVVVDTTPLITETSTEKKTTYKTAEINAALPVTA